MLAARGDPKCRARVVENYFVLKYNVFNVDFSWFQAECVPCQISRIITKEDNTYFFH